MGYIYKIFTSCSNKVYIGQTRQSIEDRYKEHLKNRSASVPYHLYNAMRKYGIETFRIEQIEECDNDVLSEREQYWIQYYDSFNNGYNMTLGGEGNFLYDYREISNKYLELKNEQETAKYFGCSVNTVKKACNYFGISVLKKVQQSGYWDSGQGKARKEKMSQKWKRDNPNKNGLTQNHKDKISQAKKGKYQGINSPNYDKKVSPETREKMIKNSKVAKPVIYIETGKIYSSALQAAKDVGLKSSAGISKCCLEERQTAGKYHWKIN